ncbi:MAG: CoA-binding protein [Bacteroidota bacterium]|nr:CoA-binding protein [Bacteroidota bacterium]MDP4233623.1 CoA-binding protein [Bacteroidota bacterium]MDP4243117.1 CoA-binding protein [Bacteroidota bacterium]MDP4288551.1 CoA-binding protein [Bacteroidota bacterium]
MTIPELLHTSKTIAIVGISDDLTRPSSEVAGALMRRGFTIIPVNPRLKEWHGIPAYPYVSQIPEDIAIDIVDIFRRSEFTPDTVRDVLKRRNKPRCIWLQQEIVNAESRKLAEDAGIFYVEDRCTAVDAALARVKV